MMVLSEAQLGVSMGLSGTGPRAEGGHWGPEETVWGRGGYPHGLQAVTRKGSDRPEQQ